nr:hypothetical protein [Mesorhizobium amorphae]
MPDSRDDADCVIDKPSTVWIVPDTLVGQRHLLHHADRRYIPMGFATSHLDLKSRIALGPFCFERSERLLARANTDDGQNRKALSYPTAPKIH